MNLPNGYYMLGSRVKVNVLTPEGQLISIEDDSKEEALRKVAEVVNQLEQQKAAKPEVEHMPVKVQAEVKPKPYNSKARGM